MVGRGRTVGRGVAAGAVALALLGLLASAWWVLLGAPRASERAATEITAAYLAGWSGRDWPAVTARTIPPADVAVAAQQQQIADLQLTGARYVTTAITVDGDRGSLTFAAELELDALGVLAYTGSLELVRTDGVWQVVWDDTALHPSLPPGGRFDRSVAWPARGRVLDVAGGLLAGGSGTVQVAVEPRRLGDPEIAIRALVDVAGADEATVRALLDRADLVPDEIYPVVELDRAVFDAVDGLLRPVPGVVFRSEGGGSEPVAAAALVGRVGPATPERIEELGAPYTEPAVVGQFGVQRALERRLAGDPAVEARILDARGEVVEVLLASAAVPGQDVQLTIDPGLQGAAEQALAAGPVPAALVVIDIPSGGLRAVANAPAGGFDRALAGRYPPGSTFKVVSSAALLGAGVGPAALLDCPAERVVGGRAFSNAGGFALGTITHSVVLARSCNTAYVGQTDLLDGGVLRDAARAFGFIDPPDSVALPHFSASFPEPADVTELAAATIGQGRVEASPAHMASVAAAVASGVWRSPILVVGDPQEERPIPGDHAALGQMMRAVVTEGTGSALAGVPGAPAGKTGSAEFGTASPPQTHAWFIGFRGDLAFAVLVEAGGAGGTVAGPIAARFLESLGGP